MSQFTKNLDALARKNRLRSLQKPAGIDLTSNDYLGMRAHPDLRRAAMAALEDGIDIGAGGSRLLRGHTEYHEALEAFAAAYFGTKKTLYFPTGYQANAALFGALTGRHDVIVFDELIHASAREAIQHSPAKHIRVRHNDLQAYEDALKKAQAQRKGEGQIWIACESLYSMDGDFAPAADLVALALKFEAMLIVDEAHATGVWGEGGRGLAYEVVCQNADVHSVDSGAETTPDLLKEAPNDFVLCKIKERERGTKGCLQDRNQGAPSPDLLPPGGGIRKLEAELLAGVGRGGIKLPSNIITMHGCGKAVGVAGGLICASAEIIDTIINTARPFIYSTAPMPLQALLVQKSLEILAGPEGIRRRQTLYNILYNTNLKVGRLGGVALRNDGFIDAELGADRLVERSAPASILVPPLLPSVSFLRKQESGEYGAEWQPDSRLREGGTGVERVSQIVPIILGEDAAAIAVAEDLQKAGYDIRAIRPPTVPEGTARLRLSLSTHLDEEVLNGFFEALREALHKKAA